MEEIGRNSSLYLLCVSVLSRALRVKNETSISENLAREGDTPIKIGVGDRLLKQIFIFLENI